MGFIVLIASIVEMCINRKSNRISQSDAEVETNNNVDDTKDMKGSKEMVLKDDKRKRKSGGKKFESKNTPLLFFGIL